MSSELDIKGFNPENRIWYGEVLDINAVPLHPDFAAMMNEELKIGDLVKTHEGQIGLIKSIEDAGYASTIYLRGANNTFYNVLVDGEERILVGYSLKKVEKNT